MRWVSRVAAAATLRSGSQRPKPQSGTRSALILGRFALAGLLLLGGAAPSGAADPVHGRYLAEGAGCGLCHTAQGGDAPAYAGGRTFDSDFGLVISPNITPDRTTGIGGWSEADFVRAMRWGIAPDDSHYLPIFPFPYFNRLTESDLADIKAFLDTLPPVSRPDLPRNSMALWERARAAVAVAATPMPGPWHDDPGKGPEWNRGAYLVATIGRCGECHTPRTWLGAPDPSRLLAGGRDWYGHRAPNITPSRAAGIGHWSADDIVTTLTDGTTPNFDEVGRSMAVIVKNTAQLSEDDRRAIAVYLQSVPPVSGPKRE
jgi:mono/diheme cytochrome c family protein